MGMMVGLKMHIKCHKRCGMETILMGNIITVALSKILCS